MGIVVLGAVFVDIKGYPSDVYIPGGRNAGRVEQMHGGVSRNIVEDIANVELQPTFIGLVDDTGAGADVVRKLKAHKVNTDYIRVTKDGMGTWVAIFDNGGDLVNAKRCRTMAVLMPALLHGAYDFIATMEDPNCEWMFLVFVLALFAVSLKLVRVGSHSDRYIDGGEGPLFFG